MRTFRQTSSEKYIQLGSVFLIALFSLSAISFAIDTETDASLMTKKDPKGIWWSITSKIILFKSEFLHGDEKINYLLDISQRYVEQIEQETTVQDTENLVKTKDAYQAILNTLHEEIPSASSETKIRAEQGLLLQEERLGYLAESEDTTGLTELTQAYGQSKQILKSLEKSKKKEAILKARETNKSDEEIANETATEEQKHSQEFEVKASQFILQAEHAIRDVQNKMNEKNVSKNSTVAENLQNASASLAKAKNAYQEKEYLEAIHFAFEAKHTALKAQTGINGQAVTEATDPLKRVTVTEKTENTFQNTIKITTGSTITGKSITKAASVGENIHSPLTTGKSVDTSTDKKTNAKEQSSEPSLQKKANIPSQEDKGHTTQKGK